MATEKLFAFAGVSIFEGECKVRFANDIMRIKLLDKKGHINPRLYALDEPMTKYEAILAIRDVAGFQDGDAQTAITEYLIEHTAKKTTKAGPAVKRLTKQLKELVTEVSEQEEVADETEELPF